MCLHSYQTELTHNAHMMQIQDETIHSLASEVVVHVISCDPTVMFCCYQLEELQQWRDRVIRQQHSKAATVIQKYW